MSFTRELKFTEPFFKYSNWYANGVFALFTLLSVVGIFEPFLVSIEFEMMVIILAIFIVLFSLGLIKPDGITRKSSLTLDQTSGSSIVFSFSIVLLYFLAVVAFSFDTRIPRDPHVLYRSIGFFLASAHGIKASILVRRGKDYGGAYLILSFIFVLALSLLSRLSNLVFVLPIVRGVYYSLLEAIRNR